MSKGSTGRPPVPGAIASRVAANAGLPRGNEPKLMPTDMNLREALPIIFAFIFILPFLAAPWILGIALRLESGGHCGSVLRCMTQAHATVRLLELVTPRTNLPPGVLAHPLLTDLLAGMILFILVLFLASALHIPLFGAISPVLNVTERKRSRTASSYPFTIVEPMKSHRLAVHIKGRFAGYPGSCMITLKLSLPGGYVMQVDHHLKPAADGDKGGITDFVFDPFFYQFTPPKRGPAELWVGYGNGPDCKLSVTINRRY